MMCEEFSDLMRRSAYVLVAVLFATIMCACGGGGDSNNNSTSSQSANARN